MNLSLGKKFFLVGLPLLTCILHIYTRKIQGKTKYIFVIYNCCNIFFTILCLLIFYDAHFIELDILDDLSSSKN